MPAPLPPNEAARLDALHRLQVLDTPPESEFDDLTRLAATVCGTPIALVSLIDADRLWFKSAHGLDATGVPRGGTLCEHTVDQGDLFEVADVAADGRFATQAIVAGLPHTRFYAGVPLVNPDGHALGTLCVIDRAPRTLTAEQRDALRVLGRQVVAQLLLRTRVNHLTREAREYETFRVLFERSSDAHLIFDERDGIIDCNHAAVAMLRLTSKEQVLALHPAALSPEFQPCGRRSMEKCVEMDAAARRNGFHRFDWTHRRADGEEFPCEVTLTPVTLHGRSVLLVVWHDLTERVRAEESLRFQAALRGSLTESGPDGILVVDENLRILSVNRRFFEVWGIPEEVGESRCDARMLAAAVARTADPDKFRARVEEIYARPDMVAADEVALADGRVLERHTGPVRGADGRQYGRVWYFRDVTARKRAEDAARASAERRRQQQIALLELIREDARDTGEAATRRVLGVVAGILQVERVSVWHLTPGRDRLVCGLLYEWGADRYSSGVVLSAADYPAYFQALASDEVIAAGDALTDPRTREFRDGYLAPLGIGAMLDIPLRLNGRVGGVLCAEHVGGRREWAADEQVFALAAAGVLALAAEQAERKRAEEALRAGEERFRAAFDHAPIGMALVSVEGRWLRVNRALCGILGYTSDELLATDFQALTHPDDLGADLDLVRQIQAGEMSSYQLEKRYFHKSGAVVHAVLSVSLARDADGRPLYFISHIKDVTARKRAELELRASEEQLRTLGDNLPDGVVFQYVVGTDGRHRFPYMSRGIERLAGVTAEAVMADADVLFGQTHPDDVGPLAAAIRRSMEELSEFDMEIRRINPDGEVGWFHARTAPRRLPDGSTAWDGVMIDVTDRKRTENELRASEEKFRTTLDRLAEGVFVVDVDTDRIVDVNAALLAMLGYTRDEFLALALYDLMSGETTGSFERTADHVRKQLAADGRCDMGRRAFRRKDGTPVPVDMKVTVVPNGRAGLRAVIARDATQQVEYEEQLLAYQEELERANARLKALATTDGLTGVKNRVTFDGRLAEEFERAVRHGHPLSVVMLDVDFFKPFNDTFGHPAGDAVLRRVARILADTVRGTDVVARYGGEEFVVLLPDTDHAGAMVLAERLRRGVAAGSWEQRPITISVGVSTLTPTTADAAALVEEADRALYRSKEAGRNRVTHGSNPIPQAATTRALPVG